MGNTLVRIFSKNDATYYEREKYLVSFDNLRKGHTYCFNNAEGGPKYVGEYLGTKYPEDFTYSNFGYIKDVNGQLKMLNIYDADAVFKKDGQNLVVGRIKIGGKSLSIFKSVSRKYPFC